MRILKKIFHFLYLSIFIAFLMQLCACNLSYKNKSNANSKIIKSESVGYIIDEHSLKKITPGKNSIPKPARVKAGSPIKTIANLGNILIVNPKSVKVGRPKENKPG